MRVLHLLTSGNIGGIEVLCRDIGCRSKIDNVFCFMFGNGVIYEQMCNEKYSVYSFAEYGKISWERFAKLLEIAKKCHAIVVHHDDPFLEMYYALLKICMPKKKFVSMIHHCYEPELDKQNYGFLKLTLKKIIVGIMFKISNKLIFVSNAGYQSYLEGYKIDKAKTEIIYNGIGEEKLADGRNCKKKVEPIIRFLYAGRLVELKGVSQLIEAFSKMHAEFNVVLDIVGDGSEREKLQEMVADAKIADKVKFHGFQMDITPYLRNADVFVYPSKTEIFGISLVEAMAYKCICIANNVGGIPEIVSNGENGLLNVDNSVEGLVVKMREAILLCNDFDKRNEVMAKAFLTAEYFSVEKTIWNLEKLFVELVGE